MDEKIDVEGRFEKYQIIQSIRYKDINDLLNVILENGKYYTIKEVDKLVDNFMKAKVN